MCMFEYMYNNVYVYIYINCMRCTKSEQYNTRYKYTCTYTHIFRLKCICTYLYICMQLRKAGAKQQTMPKGGITRSAVKKQKLSAADIAMGGKEGKSWAQGMLAWLHGRCHDTSLLSHHKLLRDFSRCVSPIYFLLPM